MTVLMTSVSYIRPVRYSVGFLVSPEGDRVLLLEKARPDWIRGLWNGVGGHIERGESPFEAMMREAAEEAALPPLPWKHLGVINAQQEPGAPFGSAQLVVFAAIGDVDAARTMTDEPVRPFAWEEVERLPLAPTTQMVLETLRRLALPSFGSGSLVSPPVRNHYDSDRLFGVRLATSVWGIQQSHEITKTLAVASPDELCLLEASGDAPLVRRRRSP